VKHSNYDHQKIETKWLDSWEEQQLFQDTAAQGKVVDPANKMYLLFAFAYPSGSGLHVGHVESKTALDILARYYRMSGNDVFFPVGWDAFGLPAENYAIKTGVPPAQTTREAIKTFRRQVKRVGISYDWANEIATMHPEYYKWTQWIFLELYKAGLAFKKLGKVNWCPSCQTVLANEQVVDGLCERCDSEVEQKDLDQWYFQITKYKDELIDGLDQVDWPEPTKQQQVNWIGRQKGVNIDFEFVSDKKTPKITCFTTRIDTVFGVSFVVISPEKFEEMSLIELVAEENKSAVVEYVDQAFKKTEEDRQIGEKEKTGVNTGLKVTNPVSGEEVPVFVADYVLGGYGTGSVMGVPAHDTRDKAFAEKYNLPIVQVIDAPEETAYGKLINSGKYDGMTSQGAMEKIPEEFAEEMEPTTTYKLRDWLISRQRYWGAPIPIVYDPEGNPHPVKEEHLPWMLPTDVDFKPTGESPLKSSKEFIERTEKLYGEGWRPEFDTMDTFVDSSWYYLRYCDSRNSEELANSEQLKKWLPVDFYMIGPEHIVLHLLYSRFFTKFLRDQGYLNFDEPFLKMRHQGMILGPDGKKMSKSKGNVINPDLVVEKYGADTLRIYEMFMGPIESDKPWDESSVAGVNRFLRRIYTLSNKKAADKSAQDVLRKLHQVIEKVSGDVPELKFNTAIASMMELVNIWEDVSKKQGDAALTREDMKKFVRVLAPFAPFLSEELWQILGGSSKGESIHLGEWPTWDPELVKAQSVVIAIQVNGKVRAQIEIAADQVSDKAMILEEAKKQPNVARWLEGKDLIKEIYVPGKIVNLVI
jgi:leucyl-tRNA synthetase